MLSELWGKWKMFYFGQRIPPEVIVQKIVESDTEAKKLTAALDKVSHEPDPIAALVHNLRSASLRAQMRKGEWR